MSANIFSELAPPEELDRAEPNTLLDRFQESDLLPVLVFVIGTAITVILLTFSLV